MTSTPQIVSLPFELIETILMELEWDDVLRVRGTSLGLVYCAHLDSEAPGNVQFPTAGDFVSQMDADRVFVVSVEYIEDTCLPTRSISVEFVNPSPHRRWSLAADH
ncbi:hypothetical protein ONZ45_g15402 [Pleurotus djamor]|nr:hypothetical protein ONZ45_g15402 [Pleurotus djamor]